MTTVRRLLAAALLTVGVIAGIASLVATPAVYALGLVLTAAALAVSPSDGPTEEL